MLLQPKLKGKPSKTDHRDLREEADQLILDATLPSDGFIISAIYLAITSDKFPALTKSMVAAGKKLYQEKEKRMNSIKRKSHDSLPMS